MFCGFLSLTLSHKNILGPEFNVLRRALSAFFQCSFGQCRLMVSCHVLVISCLRN